MYTNFYTLPEVSFVGGATQTLKYNLTDENGDAFDLSDCTVDFAIVDYSTRSGVVSGETSTSNSTVTVTIAAEDTVGLSGKYIYQITIKDSGGEDDEFQIPNQGLMYIAGNTHPAFITNE